MKHRTCDKNQIMETMLSLEVAILRSALEKLLEYVAEPQATLRRNPVSLTKESS